jgi:hypothetical protein
MTDAPSDDRPPPPPHRLRHLDGRGRLVAAAVALLLLLPVGASVARALDAGWIPSNDDALIVLRAFDVFSSDAPLVGQPSTSQNYVEGHKARHPGAIEFYLLALPVRLLGAAVGTLLTAAALAGGAVLITAWVAFRRAGPAVGLGAAVGLSLAMWSSGTAVLSDPISSNVGGYPLIAGTALAWALWCGDRRLWPLAVAVWSFTIQQHLAIFGIAGLVAAWGVAGAVLTTVRARREEGTVREAVRWGALSVGVGLVCWLPPLLDQVAGTGNLRTILSFSGEGRETVGGAAGLRAAGRAITFPPMLLSRSLTEDRLSGWQVIADLDTADVVGIAVGALLFAAAVAVTVVGFRRAPARSAARVAARTRLVLAATSVVVLAGGIVTVANVPDSIESARINFYRWMWTASLAWWGVVAWTVGDLVAQAVASRRPTGSRPPGQAVAGTSRASALGTGVVLVVLAVVGVGAATGEGYGDTRRDEPLFGFEADAIDAVVATLPEDGEVLLHAHGASAILAVAPAIAVGLEEAGYDVRVDASQEDGYGEHRTEPPDEGASEVWVRSTVEEFVPGEGEVVAALELTGEETSWGDRRIEVRVRPGDDT